ncbi:MAG TPA: SMI1/KNR4 family protein [Chloroflexia bacterium]|nr:SMI1/KNR4 family protein [Chloroflexia bacterium]
MAQLVKRFQEYYKTNPYFQYVLSPHSPNLILKETELAQFLNLPPNVPIVSTQRIKPLPKPVTQDELQSAEQKLEFKLPALLRELYTEVANGGFGPGILGLTGNGWRDGFIEGQTAVETYLQERDFFAKYGDKQKWDRLLKSLLPIGYGGCHYIYLLDCRVEEGSILCWASNGLDDKEGWEVLAPNLRIWLENWLDNPISVAKARGFILPEEEEFKDDWDYPLEIDID